MFLGEKRDGTIKARCVCNGAPTRKFIDREDTASPTASQESVFTMATIAAREKRDTMSADVPNACIQTALKELKDGEERTIMKTDGVLVDLLLEMDPARCGPFVVTENGRRAICAVVLRAICGMLISALLWCQ